MPDTLRRVALELGFSEILPFAVAAQSESAGAGTELMAALHRQGIPAGAPIAEFQQRVTLTRPEHRPAVYELAVSYLQEFADDPRAELARRGFLANTLQAAFPENQLAQQARLESMLRAAYGEQLSQEQASRLLEQAAASTPAFRSAVASLAPRPEPDRRQTRWMRRLRACWRLAAARFLGVPPAVWAARAAAVALTVAAVLLAVYLSS